MVAVDGATFFFSDRNRFDLHYFEEGANVWCQQNKSKLVWATAIDWTKNRLKVDQLMKECITLGHSYHVGTWKKRSKDPAALIYYFDIFILSKFNLVARKWFHQNSKSDYVVHLKNPFESDC